MNDGERVFGCSSGRAQRKELQLERSAGGSWAKLMSRFCTCARFSMIGDDTPEHLFQDGRCLGGWVSADFLFLLSQHVKQSVNRFAHHVIIQIEVLVGSKR